MWRKLPRLVLPLALWAGAAAAEVPASDEAAIRGVIERQIAAFGRDDGAAAFALASPELQAMFGSADNFMAMVRRGYQPVYRPREYNFDTAQDLGDIVEQPVPVIGPDGHAYVAVYSLERDADGWRIAGCRLEAKASPGS